MAKISLAAKTVKLFSLSSGDKFRFKGGSRRWYKFINANEHGCIYEGFSKKYTTNKNRNVVKANFK